MLRDLRIAFRTLLRRRSFAIIAVATLALGIGATAAIFTIVNAVLLEPLSYPAAERLVRVDHPVPLSNPEWRWRVSEAGFFDMRARSRGLEELAVYSGGSAVLGGEDGAERVSVTDVSANLFEVLGARAVAGRLLRWADNEPRSPRVVVLSEELWRTRFRGDPGVIGSTVELNGRPIEVAGVVESGFDVPDGETDLWYPAEISAGKEPVNWHRFDAIGRLGAGVTPEAAESDLNRLILDWPERLPNAYAGGFMERTGFRAAVTPLREAVVGDVKGGLWVLLAAVGIVLLIGCVNVANLFLVRMEASRRESALRTALGASWRDLATRWLSESLLVGVGAAVLGLLLAWWGLAGLVAAGPDIPRLEEVAIGWKTAAFTAALTLLAAVALGLLPVIRSGIRFEWLREGVGLTSSRERHAARRGLVVFEIALAVVLLAGAGLMIRTFQNLRAVDPGLEADGVLTLSITLPFGTYRAYEDVAAFHRELQDRLARIGGVEAVGATTDLPLAGTSGCALLFSDDPGAQEPLSQCFAAPVLATPGYFDALGIEVRGEAPDWLDMEGRRGGVVVTRAFAEHVWPGQDAIGRTVKGNGRRDPYYRIVGVAGDIRANGLDQPPVPQVYFPMLPMEGAPLWSPPRSMDLVVRTAARHATSVAPAIRSAVRDMDAGIALGDVRPMTAVVADSMRRTSLAMLLLAIAALVALALGVIGLYGVISYVVEQRRSEIGIRMALGAGRGQVRGMVVREAAGIALVGVTLGVAGSLAVTRVLSAQLYQVDPRDPVTLVAVAGLLVAVALLAAWIPATSAARVEPMMVLRGE